MGVEVISFILEHVEQERHFAFLERPAQLLAGQTIALNHYKAPGRGRSF